MLGTNMPLAATAALSGVKALPADSPPDQFVTGPGRWSLSMGRLPTVSWNPPVPDSSHAA
jgi:hypothetical protein